MNAKRFSSDLIRYILRLIALISGIFTVLGRLDTNKIVRIWISGNGLSTDFFDILEITCFFIFIISMALLLIWAALLKILVLRGTSLPPIYFPAKRLLLKPITRRLIRSNRKRDILEIKSGLIKNSGAIIVGVKGVGKSSLAAYIAGARDFWLDFIGKSADLHTLLLICAQWLGDVAFESSLRRMKAKSGEQEIMHLCWLLNQDSRTLFFDNIETLLDRKSLEFTSENVSLFFELLLTCADNYRVVITSRLRPRLSPSKYLDELSGVRLFRLKGLGVRASLMLLRHEGVEIISRKKLREISKVVDGNPLLLKILPNILKQPGEEEVLKDLKKWKDRFKGEGVDLRLLSEAAREGRTLICRMSVVPDPVSLDSIKILSGKDLDGEKWAKELVNRSLLEWNKDEELFQLNPAISEAALKTMRWRPWRLREVRRKAMEMYLVAAKGLKPPEEWKSIEDCHPYLRALEQLLELSDFDKAAELLVTKLHEPIRRWGHWRILRRYYEDLIRIWRDLWWKPFKPWQLYGYITRNYGNLLDSLGDYHGAIGRHQEHLKITRKTKDRHGQGQAYGNLGNAYFSLGEYDKAIEFHEKRLAIARDIGDRPGEGNAHSNLGNAYFALGEYDKAVEFYERALAIAHEIGDRHGEGNAYGNLGNAYFSLGKYDKAIEFHEKSLAIAHEIGDMRGEGNAYGNLGGVYGKLEKYDKAVDFHQRAAEILEQIGNLGGVATNRLNSAVDYMLLGDWPNAVPHAVLGLLIAQKIKIPEASKGLNLVSECREQLGEERFREIAVESIGEERAEEVDRILAQAEKEPA